MIVKVFKGYFSEEQYVGGVGSRDGVFSVAWDVLTTMLLKVKTLGHFTLSRLVVTEISAES